MNVYELSALLTLDKSKYEQGLNDAEGRGKDTLSKLGSVASAAGKVIAAGITAAATGIAAVTKTAVDNYAEFEQLEGGAKLMFGEGYDYIMKKASEAYKNVQMSQNDYLTQVNGLATGLKTALDGDAQAAAELADRVITAEADVVAATGNSQEAVQNAFNGIMKSNYTMLDNLGLGITPTKEGMQEVIDKVNEWNAAQGNLTQYTMDSLADQQAALVDYVEMQGMANYAQEEGQKTIQGSLASTKAAWSNLLTGLATDGADIDSLLDGLIDSASAFGEQVTPVITRVISGLGDLVNKVAPVIADQLPGLVTTLLPKLISAATSLFTGVMKALPTIISALAQAIPTIISEIVKVIPTIITSLIDAIITNVPLILEAVLEGFEEILNGLTEAIPLIIEKIPEFIAMIATAITENLEGIIDAAIQMIVTFGEALIEALPQLIEMLPTIITGIINALLENIPTIIEAGITLFLALVENIPAIIEGIVNAIPQIISGLIEGLLTHLPEIISAGVELFIALITNLPLIIVEIVKAIPQIVVGIVNAFAEHWDDIKKAGSELLKKLWDGISGWASTLWTKVKGVASSAVTAIKQGLGSLWQAGQDWVAGLWNGISDKLSWLIEKIKGFGQSALDAIKNFFGIKSPSRVMRYQVGNMLGEGLALGIEDMQKRVSGAMMDLLGVTDMTTPTFNINTNGGLAGGYVFNQTINSPTALEPSEVARQTKNATRQMVLAVRGV